ncbi:hypothetical protein GCM10011374_36180 [Kocuria dechangensis]|uniref:Activator of Hsp90 ATPase homologue 1/2-like C-terminal domain-containing protein n=1 Tax=Kocuria dechangensis TaxID=1176249 RepID=A0A917H5X1_9MICC|nr:SRPBCC domain-containing protein [Kocuria dechangensis]GGG68580.1 hypothetical protein GCM10011374_36180 [Kocuria dechangensis]
MTGDPGPRTGKVATPAGELEFSRVLQAPIALVYRCLTDPQHLTHFWGPTGMSTPIETIVVDPRPGGAFQTTMVNDTDGTRYRMRAVFDEVTAPHRLVWTDLDTGMVTTTVLTDLGENRTQVHIHQTHVPPPAMAPGAQAGFGSSLDRFTAYAHTLTAPTGDPTPSGRTE